MTLRSARLVVAFSATLAISDVSLGEKIGVQLDVPILTVLNTSVMALTYDESTDSLSVVADPFGISFPAPTGFRFLSDVPSGDPRSLTIDIIVDDSGALVGGVGGDDLVLRGRVDVPGLGVVSSTVGSPLLTAEVLEFGFEDTLVGTTDEFDFRFEVTGGLLAVADGFGSVGSVIGVQLSSEFSTFTGVFTQDFGGNAKGNLGPIAGECTLEVEKTCCIPSPPATDFTCKDAKPITSLTLKWNGANGVNIIVTEGPVQEFLDVDNGDVVVINTVGLGNDVDVDILDAASNDFIGSSQFHVSCSDAGMNGLEDCGTAQGDGKDNDGNLVNDWLFEGMAGDQVLACTVPDPGPQTETNCTNLPGPFDCDKPIDSLTMIWDGAVNIKVKAYKGNTDAELLLPIIDNIMPGDEVTVSGYAGSPNDVIWEIFLAGTDFKIGESTFHMSCSDPGMNGPEDCGQPEGDGKDKAGFINDWLLEGIIDANATLDCTPPDPAPPLFLDACELDGGGTVEYQYTITNTSGAPLDVTSVLDDPLGELLAPEFETLGPGESVTLFETVTLDETTTNLVTVFAETGAGTMCEAVDSVTVTVVPPECEISGEGTIKIDRNKVEWKLTNVGGDPIIIDSIVLEWPPTNGSLKKVKLNKRTIFEQQREPPSTTIDAGWKGQLKDRRIDPGKTKKLKFEFVEDVVGTAADYAITVNFVEGCSITFVPGPPGEFDCDKPIDELTMIWIGLEDIRVKAYKGNTDAEVLADIDDIMPGDEVTVSGYAGSPNDVIWEIFEAFTDLKLGESTFHMSCSDPGMNGPEDCGQPEGDGKDKAGFINDWLLEGIIDANATLDCTP